MYVPAFNAFLKNIDISADDFNSINRVSVPKDLLKFLLQLLLANGSFNEAGYLRANPDVAEAIKLGRLPNARMHYIGYGFFEGRTGGTPDVDEMWYRMQYPDVDQAVKNATVKSAAEHFEQMGASEGRSPNLAAERDAEQWKRAFGRS